MSLHVRIAQVLKLPIQFDLDLGEVFDRASLVGNVEGPQHRGPGELEAQLKKDFPDVKTVRLEQNYRSTKNILQLADSVIKANTGQIDKKLWTDNPEGDKIVVLEARSERDEGMKVERFIRDINVTKGTSYGEFAILYRTNAQSRALEDSLRRASIPYVIIGGVNFYQRKEIKDALAYLRLTSNRDDDSSFERVVNKPTRGISARTVEIMRAYARANACSMWRAAGAVASDDLNGRAANAVNAFMSLIERMARETNGLDLHDKVDHVIHLSALVEFFKKGPQKKIE